jgi:hypothetical protein
MPFKSGDDPNINRAGKPKGTLNKTTKEIREAYQKLTENNLDNMSVWLADVAAENPEKALDIMIRLSEYVIPKLARQEVVGNDGSDLFKNISFNFGPDVNDTEGRDNEEV